MNKSHNDIKLYGIVLNQQNLKHESKYLYKLRIRRNSKQNVNRDRKRSETPDK